MPGMPIFQDSPSQLKGQIYVLNSVSKDIVPLQVDNTGNLAVNGTVGLASGSNIDTLSTITNDVKIVNGSTPLTVDFAESVDIDTISTVTTLDTITNDVKIINGSTPLTVGIAESIDVDTVSTVTTLDTITNDVKIINGSTPLAVENKLVFTNVDSFGAGTPLTETAVGLGATVTADSQDVSQESSYNWFIKNTGTDSEDQNITLKVEISPDGTNWLEDTGTTISVPYNTSKVITVTNFLQYARFTITGGAAATTVISCFQAQHWFMQNSELTVNLVITSAHSPRFIFNRQISGQWPDICSIL